MALFDNMGNELYDADVTALVGTPQAGPNVYVTDRDVYERKTYPGTNITSTYLLFPRNYTITEKQYQYMLASATDTDPTP